MRPSANRHVLSILRKVLAPMEQHRLAKHVGCSVETIRKLEKGKLKLSESLARKVFVATGVSPDWLLANDFNAPIVAFHKNEPYTKATFQAVQGAKNLPEAYQIELQQEHVLRAFGMMIGALIQAQATKRESATVVYYQICEFADELAREFSVDLNKYAKQVTWPVFDHPAINLLEAQLAAFRKRDAPLPPPEQSSGVRKKRSTRTV